MVGVEASLDELESSPGCKIIHLSSPNHFLLVTHFSSTYVQVLSQGRIALLSRGEALARYTGYALIVKPDSSLGGPRLRVERLVGSFGTVRVGQVVEGAFVLRNDGSEGLTIKAETKKCCGAASVTIAQEKLKPGECTKATVRFAAAIPGETVRSATILTNDPHEPVAFLTLRGCVVPEVTVYPVALSVETAKDRPSHLAVVLTGAPTVIVQQAKCTDGRFGVSVGQPLEAAGAKTWRIDVLLSPGTTIGPVADTLTIRTTDEVRPLVIVPIHADVHGDLCMTPASVFFGFVKIGGDAHGVVMLRSLRGASFAVKGAVASGHGIEVETPKRQVDGWAIRISVDTAKSGVTDGEVTITTDVAGEESVIVPVYAHVIAGER